MAGKIEQPRIDLFSDTKSRPREAMLQAMMRAETGDEQAGEDTTTLALCEKVCELLGKEAALFLPSGTMCNQIALAVHCRPGDEIIAERTSHIINFETGGAAVLARAMIHPIDGERGQFTVDQARRALRPEMRHMPNSRMIAVEQTANMGGGGVWPLEMLHGLSALTLENGMVMHMDGARLINAVVASGISAKDYGAAVDTLWIDLSKGLGCPVGAVLAGSEEFIAEAWKWKQRLGGAMRQSGILAAAGIYALENNVLRMAEDHANAKLFAKSISNISGVSVDVSSVETNIVIFSVENTELSAPQIAEQLLTYGIRVGMINADQIRAVTHLDVDRAGVEEAAYTMSRIVQNI
ncbi:MAG: low specificity L-threonine aldolase [Rhodospirillaceae bacterium]|nr:low specificity L-threonine aldolase [Rhodospirillaceae bacterium]